MTHTPPPPMSNLVPPTAPFTPEQRAWLNGFFAGLVSLDHASVTALSPQQSAALMPGIAAQPSGPSDDGDDGEAPWHDQTLPLAERMTLAANRPLRRRMMAAMAQQDCGQCGYNCQDYSDALFFGKEKRLNLCVPGGKDTARMLKTLYAEMANAPPIGNPGIVNSRDSSHDTSHDERPTPTSSPGTSSPGMSSSGMGPGRSRDDPAAATFISRSRLNKPGSEKETWHLEFDLTGSGIDYAVGDSFGLYPTNDPTLVDAIIALLDAEADFPVNGRGLRDALLDSVSLSPAPDTLFQLISYITGGERRQKAKALASGEDPDSDAETLDVLGALEKFSGIRPDPEAFIEALDPLQPRLYSISSSPKVDPRRLSLTVDAVRYRIGQRVRLGAASTFLAERAAPGDILKVYVQKAHSFGLPADPSIPVIMIGPGTGIAPFRAFLHERTATKASGRNWLFFGHQRSGCDFFYEDELTAMKATGVLTRLTLAWSRDGDQKIYVQDRMREVGRDLWAWLADGAHVYVCGDAKRMAKDVERALVDIVAQFGARSTDEAIAFVADLKKKGRYQQDVY